MPYIIRKASRAGTAPYAGPACEAAKVLPGKLYFNLDEATIDAKKLRDVNPVGFEVVAVDLVERDLTGPEVVVE